MRLHRKLLGILVLTMGCPAGGETGSMASHAARAHCITLPGGAVYCFTGHRLAERFGARSSDAVAEVVRELAELADKHDLDPESDVWYSCGSGDWHEVRTLSAPMLAAREGALLSRRDAQAILQACAEGLQVSLDDPVGSPGKGSRSGYDAAVDRAVSIMEEQLGRCGSGAGATMTAGGALEIAGTAFSGLRVIGGVTYGVMKRMSQAQRAKEDFRQGAEDAWAGKPPQKDEEDRYRTKTPYGQGYDTVRKICNANPNSEGCAAFNESQEEDPPPEDPEPEDPPPEDPPPDDPGPPVADCFDFSGCSACKSAQEAWGRFKDRCEQTDWRTYECTSFVAGMNNCPDPGQVYPSPDGGYDCGSREVTAEQRRAANEAACEARGWIAQPGLDATIVCIPPARVSHEEGLRIVRQRACLYAISDECFGGETIVDVDPGDVVLPPLPILGPMPAAATSEEGSPRR